MRFRRDLVFIAIGWLLIGYSSGISAIWKIGFAIIWALLVIIFPLIALFVSELFATEASKADVLAAVGMGENWRTVPEVKDVIESRLELKFPRHVSLTQVAAYFFELGEEGLIEGRERQPPQVAWLSGGNIWEYHRK